MKLIRKKQIVTEKLISGEGVGTKQRRFFSIDDIADVANYTRVMNGSKLATSQAIAKELENRYYNLRAVPVKLLVHEGIIETTHWVNITKDRQYVIDATGDRFSYTNFSKYKYQVSPWVLQRSGKRNTYFSMNHLPSSYPEELGDSFNDTDVVLKSRSPFYKQMRCIWI